MSFKKMLCMLLSATMIATSATPAFAAEGDAESNLPTPLLEFDFSVDSKGTVDGKTTVTGTTTVGNGKATAEVLGGVEIKTDDDGNEVASFPNDGAAVYETGILYNPTDYYEEVYNPGTGENDSIGEVDPMKSITEENGAAVAVWMKIDAATEKVEGNPSYQLVGYGATTGSNEAGIPQKYVSSMQILANRYGNDGNTNVYYRDGGGSAGNVGKVKANNGDPYKSGKWQLVVMVEEANSQNCTLYIDGEKHGTTSIDANRTLRKYADDNAADMLYIGFEKIYDTSDKHFIGDMDSVAVYDRALTAEEIAAMYNDDAKIIAQKAAEEKATADQKAADAVITLIDAIPEEVVKGNEETETAIAAARAAYDALTADQKDLIDADTLKKLTDAEELVADAPVEEVKPELEAAIEAADAIIEAGNDPDETTGDTKWTADSWEAFVAAYNTAKEVVEGDDSSAMVTAKINLERAQAGLKEYKNDLVLQFDFKDHGETDAEGNTVVYGKTGTGRTVKAIAHGVEFVEDELLGEEVVSFHKTSKNGNTDCTDKDLDQGITYDAYDPYDPEDADHVGDNLFDPEGDGNPYNPYDPMNELEDNHATISMWIKTDGKPFASPMFAYGSLKNNGTDKSGLGQSVHLHGRQGDTQGAVFYRGNDGNTNGQKFSTTKASPYFEGQWQLLVLVENGNSKVLYANGEEIGRNDNIERSLKLVATDPYYNDKIYIGYQPFSDANGADTHFEGDIATVTIYNRAYSAEEVMAMYMEKGPFLNYNMAVAAYEVINQIPALDEITLEDKEVVEAARAAYDKLIYQVQKDWLEGIVEDNELFEDYEPVATGTLARIEAAEAKLELLGAEDSLTTAVAEQEKTYTDGQEAGDWTDDTWATYKAAYEAAQNPAEDVDTVEEYQALEDALKEAAAGLITNAEIAARAAAKVDLQKAIDDAKATYDRTNEDGEYSTSTWNKFKNAYDAAVKMMNNQTAFSDEIIECKEDLVAAKEGLKQGTVGEARAALRAAIEAAKATYTAGNANSKYTADSWSAFAKAYTDATAIVDVNSSKAPALNSAVEALTAAQAALKLYVAPPTGGNTTKPSVTLTADEQAIVKELGVTNEVAQAINKVAAEMKIDKDTLYISEKDITSLKKNADVKGSTFAKMQVKVAKQDTKSVKLSWKKVSGADGYVVYGAKAGKTAFKKLGETTKNTYTQKSLKKGTAYKYIVVAYKNVSGTKVTVAAAKTTYTITKGGKNGVAKKIAVSNVKKSKVTVKVKKTFTLKTKETKADKKIKNIVKVRYESSNPAVATVSSKGKIKGIKKGKATIYAFTQNGMSAKVTVTVK